MAGNAPSENELAAIAARGGAIGEMARALIARCAYCAHPIGGKRRDAVYCGPTCRQRACRARRRNHEPRASTTSTRGATRAVVSGGER